MEVVIFAWNRCAISSGGITYELWTLSDIGEVEIIQAIDVYADYIFQQDIYFLEFPTNITYLYYTCYTLIGLKVFFQKQIRIV